MLHYVSDDIFASPAQTLVNTVNTAGVMGKGIAAEFKRRFPEMFARYQRHCREGTLTVDRLYLYRSPHKWVLNFPTKQHWRNPSRLEWIEAGLAKFAASYEHQGITSAAFPQLGCGNGGLDWAAVKPLMARYLGDLPIPVFVHTRATVPGFVPEHQTEGESDLSSPRVTISFSQFVRDLLALSDRAASPDIATKLAGLGADIEDGNGEEILDLDISLPLEDGDFEIPLSNLETLWNKLMRRGALSPGDFPELKMAKAEQLAAHLRQLDYIRSMHFVQGRFSAPELRVGIRFAPPASLDDPRVAVVRAAAPPP